MQISIQLTPDFYSSMVGFLQRFDTPGDSYLPHSACIHTIQCTLEFDYARTLWIKSKIVSVPCVPKFHPSHSVVAYQAKIVTDALRSLICFIPIEAIQEIRFSTKNVRVLDTLQQWADARFLCDVPDPPKLPEIPPPLRHHTIWLAEILQGNDKEFLLDARESALNPERCREYAEYMLTAESARPDEGEIVNVLFAPNVLNECVELWFLMGDRLEELTK